MLLYHQWHSFTVLLDHDHDTYILFLHEEMKIWRWEHKWQTQSRVDICAYLQNLYDEDYMDLHTCEQIDVKIYLSSSYHPYF